MRDVLSSTKHRAIIVVVVLAACDFVPDHHSGIVKKYIALKSKPTSCSENNISKKKSELC